jgi:Domain of unknown function (DUF1992)
LRPPKQGYNAGMGTPTDPPDRNPPPTLAHVRTRAEREAALRSLDDEIGRAIADAAAAGELKTVSWYGKPIEEIPGWDDTPAELRMPFKILKDAGVVPPEIELFHQRARLREQIAALLPGSERDALNQKLVELEQVISLRLEALRASASPSLR